MLRNEICGKEGRATSWAKGLPLQVSITGTGAGMPAAEGALRITRQRTALRDVTTGSAVTRALRASTRPMRPGRERP